MTSLLILLVLSLFAVNVYCITSLYHDHQQVKTIKVKKSLYDCMDFYKQRAFNNPLMKNHTSKATTNLIGLQARKINAFGLRNSVCPIGTVPILRFRPDIGGLYHPFRHNSTPREHCVAMVHTNNLSWKLFGSGGGVILHRPLVEEGQWSTARIKLLNGNDNIEAGWMVNPSLYHDNEAHLYAKLKTKTSGCFNLECPGFVQVATSEPLGISPREYSVIKGKQWYWNISIEKHQDDEHWWLSITDRKILVGYWPKEIFTELANFANQAEWGGEIDNPGAKRPIPEMGNGLKATYDLKYSAKVLGVTIVNDKYESVNPGRDTHKVWNCEDLYTVKDAGYTGKNLGRIIFYGGSKNNPPKIESN